MSLANNEYEYGGIARTFHWIIALLIMGLILVGLYMGTMEYSPQKLQVYGLHKSFGLLVLWLASARIIWRFVSLPPDALGTHAAWERGLAKITHVFLYIAMFGMPLSGWIMSSAGEFPVVFFGYEMPALTGKNESLAHLMREVHETMAFILIGAILLHAAGAFKHHLLDKDTTLRRMASGKMALPLMLLLALFAAGVGWLMTQEEEHEGGRTGQAAQITEDLPTPGLNEWVMVPSQSALTFEAYMTGTPFSGQFKKFDASILFDPENLPASKAIITIDIASLDTGDASRNEQIQTKDWFFTEGYPKARFETRTFEHMDGKRYLAVGDLTLRGVTLPVTLPFTLDIEQTADGRLAHVQGELTLNRLEFGVGQGQWQSTDAIGDSVKVKVSLTANGAPSN